MTRAAVTVTVWAAVIITAAALLLTGPAGRPDPGRPVPSWPVPSR